MPDLEPAAESLRDRLTKAGAVDFEIFAQTRSGVSLEVLKGKRSAFEVKNTAGYAVRVLVGERLGFAYGSDFSASGFATVCEHAVEAAGFTEPDPGFQFAPATTLAEIPSSATTDLANIPLTTKLDLALRMEAACYAHDVRVRTVRNASYDDEIEDTLLWTSAGCHARQRRVLCTLGVSVVAEADGESEVGGDMRFAQAPERLDPELVGRTATTAAVDLLGGRPMASAVLPIILTSEVASQFLSVLAASFGGEAVVKGQSILAGKQGEELYAPGLTIIDDGLYLGGIATAAFDGEGTPQQRTVLVQNGRATAFLFDRFWGYRSGTKSTGNARRAGIAFPPKLGSTNLYIPAGSDSFVDLLRRLGDGVVITEVIGMHLANVVSGRFSIGFQGYRVQNGVRGQTLRGTALAGNVHELFRQVRAIGSDLRFHGRIGAPSLLIESAEISGTVV